MIVSKAPYRISFLGGGTDYKDWFQEHGGAVLSATIDKYVYSTVKPLSPFFTHKFRVVWNRIEERSDFRDIENPIVREVLRDYSSVTGAEVHYQGDLPAQCGLGSSSAFAVSLISAIKHFAKEDILDSRTIALEAIRLEREVLLEAGGIQDQIASSYGGLNHVTIARDGSFDVMPLSLSNGAVNELQEHCQLLFTGILRHSSAIAQSHKQNIKIRSNNLAEMMDITKEALSSFNSTFDVKRFAELINASWHLKRDMSSTISSSTIDDIIEFGIKSGAYGAKLLGAGGGGVILFIAPPEVQEVIREHNVNLPEIDCNFSFTGIQTKHH